MRIPAVLSLPNIVSLSRVPMAIGFLVVDGNGARVALIGVASASDLLDGWLARRERRTTRWGALLDPIADKVFVIAALTSYLLSGALSVVQLLVFASRDIATLVGFLVARMLPILRDVTFRARLPGKAVTALQLAALLAVLVAPGMVRPLIATIGVASTVAIVDYTIVLWKARAR